MGEGRRPSKVFICIPRTCGPLPCCCFFVDAPLADQSGSRHDLAMCVGGVLARGAYKAEDIPKFVEIIAREAGDTEAKDRSKAAETSVVAFKKGDPVWGRPKLGELLGQPAANAIVKLLSFNDTAAKLSLSGVSLDDFNAYMPMHNYIYMPTREAWPASSVDARIGRVPLFDSNVHRFSMKRPASK